jgi:hypothetical protein
MHTGQSQQMQNGLISTPLRIFKHQITVHYHKKQSETDELPHSSSSHSQSMSMPSKTLTGNVNRG